jgi:proline iminopeptidase
MHRLYPETKPFHEEELTTTDGHHRLWTACFGNPNGLPVVCLHGGPGAGTSPLMPRFFNPDVYHVVCFDQRGCGRSEPKGNLHANTTDDLISDLDLVTILYY